MLAPTEEKMIIRLPKFPFMMVLVAVFILCNWIDEAWKLTLKYEDWKPKERP